MILSPVRAMGSMGVPELVHSQYERFDGSGYPRRLAGEDIPLGARIVALADSLSAMLQKRPYREGMGYGDACDEVRRCTGSQFDPRVVGVFMGMRDSVFDLFARVRSMASSPLMPGT